MLTCTESLLIPLNSVQSRVISLNHPSFLSQVHNGWSITDRLPILRWWFQNIIMKRGNSVSEFQYIKFHLILIKIYPILVGYSNYSIPLRKLDQALLERCHCMVLHARLTWSFWLCLNPYWYHMEYNCKNIVIILLMDCS